MNPTRTLTIFWAAALLPLVSLSMDAVAQEPGTIRGTILDESGGVIPDVQVALRNPAGATVQTVTADGSGGFAFTGVAPGRYNVQVAANLFEPVTQPVEVGRDSPVEALRITMGVSGQSQNVVVTAGRVETDILETPKKIEIVDSRDIERSVAADVSDVLKKNSGVDVIQYNSVLAGIGIRGFRPDLGGINQRSLLLVDGRPAGATNFATLLLDNVERIEVLKGPASSVYGASAMGGVVNIITKQSRNSISGNIRSSLGNFSTTDFAGKIGGAITRRLDFDATADIFNQRSGYRTGSGIVFPFSRYRTRNGSVRLGADLPSFWRVDGSANAYRGRDIDTPGDLFNGTELYGRKNLERTTTDIRLQGPVGSHLLSATAYASSEQSHTSNVRTTNALDLPYLPYLSFEGKLKWRGVQVEDSWAWAQSNNVVFGVDYDWVESVTQSYARTGERTAPFSADNNKRTVGIFGENTLKLNDGNTIMTIGGRYDNIRVKTVDTPYKTGFTPSTTTFGVFSPSAGFKQALLPWLRAHGTVGRAFVPAAASSLTGYTTNSVGGRTQITQGNPNLRPERSVTFDAGMEASTNSTRLDVSYFQTKITNRVISGFVISNPDPPEPVIISFTNALGARIKGMDIDFTHRFSRLVSAFSNITHYFSRRERPTATTERNILNVAAHTVRVGTDLDFGRVTARIAGRYVHGRQDNDFNVAGSPVIDYPDFGVVDFTGTYRIRPAHQLMLAVNNVFDYDYFEKKGYPLAGAAATLKYQINFGAR